MFPELSLFQFFCVSKPTLHPRPVHVHYDGIAITIIAHIITSHFATTSFVTHTNYFTFVMKCYIQKHYQSESMIACSGFIFSK